MFQLDNGKQIFNVLEKNVKAKIGVNKEINNQQVKFLGLVVSKEGYFIQIPEWYIKPVEKINKIRNNKVWNVTVDPKIEKYEVYTIEDGLVKTIREITFEQVQKILIKMEEEIERVEPIKVKKGE